MQMSIPNFLPKLFKEYYKDYEYKDYGIGKYNYLYEYCTHNNLEITDYKDIGLQNKANNQYILTLRTPSRTNKIEVQLANGLDSVIESKEQQHIQCYTTKILIVNGGYKESVNV